MLPSEIAAAGEALYRSWRDGQKLDALDDAMRPRSRADGYAVQAALARHANGQPFGWKIAATSEAGQRHINVRAPMAGRILRQTLIEDGGTASMAGNAMRVAEPEFAFRMGKDLLPRPAPFELSEILYAVETLHPAIEIPDSRFADFTTAGEAQLIADNACAHRFVLGAPCMANWRALDLAEERPRIAHRGRHYLGHGRNVLGDPRAALAWLANELRSLGIPLHAEEVVTTGTCHPPLPIEAGDRVEADFGLIGHVSVGFG